MSMADDADIVDILENILECGVPNEEGLTVYTLGEFKNLSEGAELKVLKELQKDGVLTIVSLLPSGSITFMQEENPWAIVNPLTGPEDKTSFSVNRPARVILDFNKVHVLESIDAYKTKQLTGNNISKRVLLKDLNGDFRFNDKLITIGDKPLRRDTLHYRVLDTLFSKCDQLGKVSLTVMEREIQKDSSRKEDFDRAKVKKSVDNALANLFRRGRVGAGRFTNVLPGGGCLIDRDYMDTRFVGWKIHNTELH